MKIFEGHTTVFGQDTDTEPSELRSSVSAKAVNRIFRGGRNQTRPPFLELPCEFDETSSEHQEIFKHGNFQGWFAYRKKRPGRDSGIVVSIAGHLFFLVLVNERFLVRYIFGGNRASLMHAWFCQAEEWLYVQDGEKEPIFWDGMFPSSARRADPSKGEMPIGTIMAYAHGRVFVSNAFDQVAASDIIYGEDLSDSSSTQRFTENQYWTGGGYFGMPTELGPITGMIVLPRQRSSLSGQGELLILNQAGASAIEVSLPRSQWQTSPIQSVTMAGRGPIAHNTVIAVNNDCWFRSDDGLASYRLSQSETQSDLSLTKLSRQVNQWMMGDTEWLKQFSSSIYFDNRIFTTVTPEVSNSDNELFGSHYYHRGMVVLDLDKASDVQGDASFNWDGLWTGIRPCGLVKLGQRAFAFSFDSDGRNRLYEISRFQGNDRFENKIVKTQWHYVTKRFDWSSSQKSNSFEIKQFTGGQLWISDVKDLTKVGVNYRPDNIEKWYRVMPEREFGSNFEGTWDFSQPRYERFQFVNPETECGLLYPSDKGSQFQFQIYGEGMMKIDRLRLSANTVEVGEMSGDCKPNDEKKKLDYTQISDYRYNLAEQAFSLTKT